MYLLPKLITDEDTYNNIGKPMNPTSGDGRNSNNFMTLYFYASDSIANMGKLGAPGNRIISQTVPKTLYIGDYTENNKVMKKLPGLGYCGCSTSAIFNRNVVQRNGRSDLEM